MTRDKELHNDYNEHVAKIQADKAAQAAAQQAETKPKWTRKPDRTYYDADGNPLPTIPAPLTKRGRTPKHNTELPPLKTVDEWIQKQEQAAEDIEQTTYDLLTEFVSNRLDKGKIR